MILYRAVCAVVNAVVKLYFFKDKNKFELEIYGT